MDDLLRIRDLPLVGWGVLGLGSVLTVPSAMLSEVRLGHFPPAAPAYSELFAEGCFSQRRLVSATDLREAAIHRGLDLSLSPRANVLEPLDRAGGFCPIGFLQTNFTPETVSLHPDRALMVWREERRFEPWDEHGWYFDEDDPYINVSERYSPWQLLYLPEALDVWAERVPLSWVELGSGSVDQYIAERRAARDNYLRSLDEEWRPTVKLLVALQLRIWPYRRERTTHVWEPDSSGRVDPLARAHKEFDPFRLLKRFELSLDGLARLHADLADAARSLDPNPRWYRLVDAAPRKVTDDLRGTALRARDYYDAAYVVRGFYYLATSRWLPRPDELDDHQQVYERRHLPRQPQPKPFERSDLKDLLIREGLYPHRIHFFVEGKTEEIVLSRLLRLLGYGSPSSGMTVTDIGGVDQAKRHAVIFESAAQVAARTVLIADLEGSLSKVLKQLQADGLFTDDENLLLWSDNGRSLDFEEANFKPREIISAIRTAARRRDRALRLELSVAELREERVKRTPPKRPAPALAKLALELAEDRGIRVSKTELATVLAEKLAREIRRAGHLAEAGTRRPILARLWYWIANDRTAARESASARRAI
jgi:hypothetical protein